MSYPLMSTRKEETFMKTIISFATATVLVSAAGFAGAQPPEPSAPYIVTTSETPTTTTTLAAPTNAFELTLGTGYTQGFGNLQSGVGLPSIVTPGVAFDLGLGYRINPHFAVNWAGQYAELTAERTSTARSFTAGIAAQYHFTPLKKVDPWMEAGAGYRVLIQDTSIGPNLVSHGFELARLRVGIDFRPEETISLGPVVGADASMFFWQDIPGAPTTIADPRVSTFIFAGVQGRFNVGDTTRTARPVALTSATSSQ
jgi:hypothetical protein